MNGHYPTPAQIQSPRGSIMKRSHPAIFGIGLGNNECQNTIPTPKDDSIKNALTTPRRRIGYQENAWLVCARTVSTTAG
jgi:hypothetical protein